MLSKQSTQSILLNVLCLISEQGKHLVPLQCNRFECLPPQSPKSSSQVKVQKAKQSKQLLVLQSRRLQEAVAPRGRVKQLEGFVRTWSQHWACLHGLGDVKN